MKRMNVYMAGLINIRPQDIRYSVSNQSQVVAYYEADYHQWMHKNRLSRHAE